MPVYSNINKVLRRAIGGLYLLIVEVNQAAAPLDGLVVRLVCLVTWLADFEAEPFNSTRSSFTAILLSNTLFVPCAEIGVD